MAPPSKRRVPRWAIETTAWAAALVLIAGIGIVASGVISTAPVVSALDDTPVLQDVPEAPVATTAPVAPAAPKAARPTTTTVTPQTPQAPRPRARTGVSTVSVLGPPPGPQDDAVPTAFAAPADRYAFLIGVTDYPDPTHDTIGSANDVRFIRQSLLAAGWLSQNIKIFTDRQVTGQVTRDGLAWLASKSVPGTFTLFHYSGHVKQEGGHEKLWPADRYFVLDSEVASLLGRGTGRMWVDIAGCEAGGFIENLPSGHRLVTASSMSTQKSYEYPQWGESVWTGLVFDIGLRQGQADANRNGTTTVGEALRYATYYAQAITIGQRPHGRQTPQVVGDNVLGWTLSNPPA